MKLGLSTYSYRYAAGLWDYLPRENEPMTVDHFLQKAAELGLEGVQLADARHLDSLDYGYVSDLRRRADGLGQYLELATAGTNPDHLESMVRVAHVLGSPVVCTSLGGPRPASAEQREDMLAGAAAGLRAVLPVCQRYRVCLAVENNRHVTAGEVHRLLDLVESEWVGACLHTGDPLAVLEDPLESARVLAPRVRAVHVADYQVVARRDGFCLLGCALGGGVVDLPRILELLRTDAPEANLSLEVCWLKHPVAALEEDFLQQFPALSALSLGRALRLVRERGLVREPSLPDERAAPEGELLAAEDELVVESARWLSQALGRPAPELRN